MWEARLTPSISFRQSTNSKSSAAMIESWKGLTDTTNEVNNVIHKLPTNAFCSLQPIATRKLKN